MLFEDDAIIAVSKPSGLLSVPGRQARHQDSALLRMTQHAKNLGVVHRLDMDTSGVLVFAKTNVALKSLHRQFSTRQVEKRYLAWISGQPSEDTGLVDQPLICDWPNRPLQKIDHQVGKPSQTRWRVLNRHSGWCALELTPITGRSHQLRVHLAHLGHAILGDRFYASPSVQQMAGRLMLHAWRLVFDHPITAKRLELVDNSENRLKQSHLIV